MNPIVALVGNPNVGKTSLFNALTGSAAPVGNWPGKTVAVTHTTLDLGDRSITLVDLPGSYSLTPYAPDEQITRDFLLDERPALIVAVVDARTLERNLFLTAQLLELGLPTIVALTMTAGNASAAAARPAVDVTALSQALGVPVVPLADMAADELAALRRALRRALDMTLPHPPAGGAGSPVASPLTTPRPAIPYPAAVTDAVAVLAPQIGPAVAGPSAGWVALKLLEDDALLTERVAARPGGSALLDAAADIATEAQRAVGTELDIAIADARYRFAHTVAQIATRQAPAAATRSDQIDRVVTHPILGLPIFLAVMWAVFKITADVSAPMLDWVDGVIGGPLARGLAVLLQALGLGDTWVASLVIDGIVAGVGGVLVFVPVLLSLYITLAVLEESGYMARAAFVMDGVMARIGLQGKSFLPMIVGFGCTVPAIYATRTLENERDRILTALLVPFMSCGARLPVYVLFAAVFFPQRAGAVIFSLYLLGIATALGLGLILRRTLFAGTERSVLLIELPPYRRPRWQAVWGQTWERTAGFIRNATTLILATSVVLWFLMAIPVGSVTGRFADAPLEETLFARVAGGVAPALRPLGFGNWESAGALITGFVAKEVVVSTTAQVYGLTDGAAASADGAPPSLAAELGEIVMSFGGAVVDTARAIPSIVGLNLMVDDEDGADQTLHEAIRAGLTASSGGHGALAAAAFMVFVLLYTPCMVAIAAERAEIGTRWMWHSIVGQTIIAWLMAFVVFQGGRLLGLG